MPGAISLAGRIDPSGVVILETRGFSADGNVFVIIPQGTVVTQQGFPATGIFVFPLSGTAAAPSPPDNMAYGAGLYTLTPDDLVFNPSITLNFRYDSTQVPEGVDPDDLMIGWWDPDTKEWVPLATTWNGDIGYLQAQITHFSLYSVLVPLPTTANFEYSNLTVDRPEIELSKAVNISVSISNSGDLQGDYGFDLLSDGDVVHRFTGTLDGNTSIEVTCTYTPVTAGTHTISIGDASVTLLVNEPEPTPSSSPTTDPSPTVSTTPALTASPTPVVSPTSTPVLKEASFRVSNLAIDPDTTDPSYPVTITCEAANEGDVAGVCRLVLKVDGVEEAEQEVTLGPRESRTIAFTTTKDRQGTYSVNINGVAGRFSVMPLTGDAYLVRWWPFAAIIGGVVLIGFTFYLIFGRKRFV